MENLYRRSGKAISEVSDRFVRYLYNQVNWADTLIEISGGRGVGKSHMLKQYLRRSLKDTEKVLYISLDDLYFTTNTLSDAGKQFAGEGGRILGLDEVHKYPGWEGEILKLHTSFPDLQIICAASSVIYSGNENAGSSLQMKRYTLSGLSYREYLAMVHEIHYDAETIRAIVQRSREEGSLFPADFRPLRYFRDYLLHGYYPATAAGPDTFRDHLHQIVRLTVEYDMADLNGFDVRNAKKMLRLLGILAGTAPMKPNISKLSEESGIHRNSLVGYLRHLERAGMIRLLFPDGDDVTRQQKPERVYIDNPNLLQLLSNGPLPADSVRKTFLISQLQAYAGLIEPSDEGLQVGDLFHIEMYQKTGPERKISGFDPVRCAESGNRSEFESDVRVPLWMFGLLY